MSALRVRPLADVDEAFAWYAAHSASLGLDFLRAVDACFDAVVNHPLGCPIVYRLSPGELMSQLGTRYRMIAEVASATAVALTLVFVGLQLRESSRQTALNTTSLQVAAYQDLNAQISHFNELLLDPVLAQVFETMMDPTWDWTKVNPVQRRQARSLLFMRIRHADMAYYQFDRGMLSEERLNSALRPLLSDVDKPIFRRFWEEVGPRQIPAFRTYLEKRMAESTGQHPTALPDTR